MRDRLGVRGRLLLAFLGISAFALLGAGAAMYSFIEVGRALDKITQQRVPSALASLEISRQAERIVAVAPALLAVTTTTQHEQVSGTITAEVDHLNALVNELEGSGIAASALGSIESTVGQVNTNLAALDAHNLLSTGNPVVRPADRPARLIRPGSNLPRGQMR